MENTKIRCVSYLDHLRRGLNIDVVRIESISSDSFSRTDVLFVCSTNGIKRTNLSSLSTVDPSIESISGQSDLCFVDHHFNQSFESESSANFSSSISSTTGQRTQKSSFGSIDVFYHSVTPADSSLSWHLRLSIERLVCSSHSHSLLSFIYTSIDAFLSLSLPVASLQTVVTERDLRWQTTSLDHCFSLTSFSHLKHPLTPFCFTQINKEKKTIIGVSFRAWVCVCVYWGETHSRSTTETKVRRENEEERTARQIECVSIYIRDSYDVITGGP